MTSPSQSSSTHAANQLLSGLSARDRAALLACATRVRLHHGAILAEPGQPLRHVYFPIDAVICLATPADADQLLGIGLIGGEGMLGSILAGGRLDFQLRATVLAEGDAWRIHRTRFLRLLASLPTLQRRIAIYTQYVFDALARKPVCSQFHVLEQRLAYWLLLFHDRVAGDVLELTQHNLSQLLGVRRIGVSQAARGLQSRGLIHYSRGVITINDRQRMILSACACYGIARTSYAQLLGIGPGRS